MTELIFEHTEDWIEKLTFLPQDLSHEERVAITLHVMSCPDCSRYLADVVRLEEFIQALPAPDFPEGLSPRLQQLWQEEAADSKNAEFEHLIRELME